MGKVNTNPVQILKSPEYERQPYEGLKAWMHFELYRDMGPDRAIKQVAEDTGIRVDTMYKLSTKWRWKERIVAWDTHLSQIKQKAIEKAADTMSSRQAALGMILQNKANEAANFLIFDGVDNKPTARDVVALADAGVKIERVARGEITQDTDHITIVLPTLPGWAKTSRFVSVQQVDTDKSQPEPLTLEAKSV